jgi:hypothetical protein
MLRALIFGIRLLNRKIPVFCIYILFAISLPLNIDANELGVNLYGCSYHFLKSWQSREHLNEFNPGIGIRATFGAKMTSHFIIEGGTFEDSIENQAKNFSLGYLVRIVHQFRLGINAAVYSSKTIGNPSTVFGPVSMISYTLGPLTANAVYFPKFAEIVPYHVLGFYATIRIFDGKTKDK